MLTSHERSWTVDIPFQEKQKNSDQLHLIILRVTDVKK